MKTDYQSLLKNTKVITLAMFGFWYTILSILGVIILTTVKYTGHLMFREELALNGAPVLFAIIVSTYIFIYILCRLNKIQNTSSHILSLTVIGGMLVFLCTISLINDVTYFILYAIIAIISYYSGKYLKNKYVEE